jgi:membrane protease YdiL (CAAX protease family)
MVKFVNEHYILYPLIVTALTAGLYISGMPFGLLKLEIANNNVFYIVNMIFASIFCFFMIKLFFRDWVFGVTLNNFTNGVFRYGFPLIIGSVIIFVSSYWIFRPLNNSPEKGTILVWIFIYYLIVAIVEELFVRGVFFNTLLKTFDNKHKILLAVIISSITFGIGHLPGMLNQNIQIISMRIIAVICLGIFFASVYICSGNLLSIIVLHWIINISGSVLFYYSNSNDPFAITKVFLVVAIILSAWGLYLIKYLSK